MSLMRRLLLIAAATVVSSAAISAGSAAAKVIELGATSSAVSAPPPCTTSGSTHTCPHGVDLTHYGILLARVTALESVRDGKAYPTTAPADGRIVAFTVGLSALDTNRSQRLTEIKQADAAFGGTTQVQITVLRRVGKANKRVWKVVAVSEVVHVQPYLGMVVQFPLQTTLAVQKHDVVALTSPTWAPVLNLFQDTKRFAYRQSRKANCANPPNLSQAQITLNQSTTYKCDYPGTRVEYSATEITTTPFPKTYVHAPDIVARPVRSSVFDRWSYSGGAGL
jgi:hypothetical protein